MKINKLFMLCFLPYISMVQATTNTAQIMTSSLSPECIEYKVVGICYWLFCTPFGCSVRTSIKVKHFIPDVVVSAYSNTGDNPWSEMSFLSQSNAMAQSGGDTHTRHTNERTKVKFKEADVIGHPGGAIFSQFLSGFGYSCSGSATAFMPYFLSPIDALFWRSGIPESIYPESLVPGMREVGQLGDLWGNVYPRIGALAAQVNDYKVGALIAQRAADIVTRSGQVHIYQPLTSSSRPGYWPPQPVKEGDKSNHKWQMLSPKLEQTCAIFPDGQALDTYAEKIATNGAYAFALWRPYSCCKQKGQTFLGSTGG